MRVLVLDASSRAAVESIQSLARRGIEVDAADEGNSIAFSSRRLSRRLHQPPVGQPDLFLQWLALRDSEAGYSLIVPSTEGSLRHFLSLAESDPLRQKAVLPSNASLQIALDKSLTIELASKLCIPVPDTILIQAGRAVPVWNSYPAVLKPVSSLVHSEGVAKQVRPCIVRNEFERDEALRQMLPESSVLHQEYVSGRGVGVEMLYRHGKLVWHFCHERLHEGEGKPGLGSGSTYRQSIAPNQRLLRHTIEFLNALKWHGVAMMEFKVAEDGRYWLMEINPRLWGSLALAIDAGVDFPYGLLCLATGGEVPPQPAYKIGYRTRLLLPDLDWIKNRLSYRPDTYVALEILKLFLPIAGHESWDFFDWGDLAVTAADYHFFASEKLQSLRSRRVKSQQKKAAHKLHAANLGRFLAHGERPRKLLFLCHGNTCRSPFAESLLRRCCPDFEVQSAGFHPVAGRCSPPHVQSVAAASSIDLSTFLSRYVTADMVRDADAIFLHDMRNFEYFCREFPHEKDKILFLGLFLHPPVLEIQDPYSFGLTDTARVLRQISAAIDAVGRILARSSSNVERVGS